MKFFFDRCMSIRLCRMVAILETGRQHLTHHDEDPRFTQKTTDVEWIEVLSRDAERPIVVSGDCKILKRPDEVAALQSASRRWRAKSPGAFALGAQPSRSTTPRPMPRSRRPPSATSSTRDDASWLRSMSARRNGRNCQRRNRGWPMPPT